MHFIFLYFIIIINLLVITLLYERYTLLDMLLRIIHVAHGSIFVNPIGPSGVGNDKSPTIGMFFFTVRIIYLIFINKGLDVFTFSYTVRWPLSLILNRNILTKYQLIFRQLALCKYVELRLANEWVLSMV